MIALLALVIVAIVVFTVVPPVIKAVNRALNVPADDARGVSGVSAAETNERLARMEDAIDAMAHQIDRLRAVQERHYVSGGATEQASEPARIPPSIDAPPSHDPSLARPGPRPPSA